jgi:glyoxylase-like metal-dependent hydrolase (beta-lactamase superfamily II)
VAVVSTGTVEIHPEQPYGTRKPLYWWLLTSRRWTPPRPINAYIIEHAKGLILFDTGQDRASVRRRERSPVLLVGDLTYGAELLMRGQVPGVGARRQLAETTTKVLALKQTMPDLVILPAHDPTAAQRLLES